MTDYTVLVVDADQETEEVIVSTLEADGYLVFTASGRDVSSGLAEKISPSLIYLKPAALSVEGFAACKAIHNSVKFREVPIILLASLKGPLDPRYTNFYGVVDYLKMPLTPDEVLKKTGEILGIKSHDFQAPEDDYVLAAEESVPDEASARLQEAHDAGPGVRFPDIHVHEDDFGLTEEAIVPVEEKPDTGVMHATDSERDIMPEVGQPNEDYRYHETQETLGESFYKKGSRRRHKKSGLFIPVVIIASGIAIVLAGFLTYKFFISSPKAGAPVAVVSPKPVQKQETVVLPPQQEQQKQEQTAVETMPAKIKEVTKESPAVVSGAKMESKPFYSVQLGAFKSEGTAEALAKTYKEKGYETYTQKGEVKDKGMLYRVLVGAFKDRKEALHSAAEIEAKEKVKTTVFSGGTK